MSFEVSISSDIPKRIGFRPKPISFGGASLSLWSIIKRVAYMIGSTTIDRILNAKTFLRDKPLLSIDLLEMALPKYDKEFL